MQTNDASSEDQDLYYACCYISKKYQEIIFVTVWLEFLDQLCEHEPVIVMPLNASPTVLGLTAKTILALSNTNQAKGNHLFPTQISDIPPGKIFFKQMDYPKGNKKQRKRGTTYYDMPGYQASLVETINEFEKHYLAFSMRATNTKLEIFSVFNEWNPIKLSKQLPLSSDNDILGALFLDYAKHCL